MSNQNIIRHTPYRSIHLPLLLFGCVSVVTIVLPSARPRTRIALPDAFRMYMSRASSRHVVAGQRSAIEPKDMPKLR